jgi:thymidylate synthase
MFLKAKTLDDLMRRVFDNLLKSSNRISPTKGAAREMMGVVLELERPQARLSTSETKGTLFSCLGELLWYLSGVNDLSFIKYYLSTYDKFSDDGKTVWGAYGPRLFNMRGVNQIDQVRDRLRLHRDTRKAVIQLFDAGDIIEEHKDVPCICTLQFMIRGDHLFMFTSMRSNDAFLGLPHDIFSFTMLQEILARDLSVGLGSYKHAVGRQCGFQPLRVPRAALDCRGFKFPASEPCGDRADRRLKCVRCSKGHNAAQVTIFVAPILKVLCTKIAKTTPLPSWPNRRGHTAKRPRDRQLSSPRASRQHAALAAQPQRAPASVLLFDRSHRGCEGVVCQKQGPMITGSPLRLVST